MQERFESLSVDDEDTIAYRRNCARHRSPFYRNLLALMTLVIMGGWGTWHYTNALQRLAGLLPVPVTAPAAHTSMQPPVLEPQAQDLPHVAGRPRPLDECIGADNLIDSDVARCRFGKLPQPVQDANAHGMVSTRYMARYKAEQQHPVVKPAKVSSVVWSRIRQWDGKKTYPARWIVTDNRIEGASVCSNLTKGSIDYRECRKGAKVYFRDQCRAFSKTTNPETRQRYCSAAEVFNPIG